MSDDFESEETKESGSSLRAKLEAALAENKTLAEKALQAEAKVLIREKGYKHLTVEDLAGVSLNDLEATAAQKEAQKAEADAAAVRRALAAKGVPEGELDKVLSELLGQDTSSESLARIREASRIGGAPPGTSKFEGLAGKDLLYAAYATE